MLTNIENRLEELFEQIEMMPDRVEMAEKVRYWLVATHCCEVKYYLFYTGRILEYL